MGTPKKVPLILGNYHINIKCRGRFSIREAWVWGIINGELIMACAIPSIQVQGAIGGFGVRGSGLGVKVSLN